MEEVSGRRDRVVLRGEIVSYYGRSGRMDPKDLPEC